MKNDPCWNGYEMIVTKEKLSRWSNENIYDYSKYLKKI